MKRLSLLNYLIISFFCLIIVSCKNEEKCKTSNVDLEKVKKEIEATNAKFVEYITSGDSVKLASLYTSDAKILPANMPEVKGTDGIRKFGHEFAKMGKINMKSTTVDIWGDANFVTEEGRWTMSDSLNKELDKGKFLMLWKNIDGKWMMYRDIFNSDNPPMAEGK